MATATWNGVIIARAAQVRVVEGFVYFPPEAVSAEHLRVASAGSVCFWKGPASYFDVVVDGEVNEAAAWTYRDPLPLAESLRDHIAFWRGVEVDPGANVVVLEPPTPRIADALGDIAIWQPDLAALGVDAVVGSHRFSGYLMPDVHALVDVMATPAEADIDAVIDAARVFGDAVASRNCTADRPLGYIAVWGSHLPDRSTIEGLRTGAIEIVLPGPA